MKITKSQIKEIIKEEVQKLNEVQNLSSEQMKAWAPIIKKASKKLGFKYNIKDSFFSFGITTQIVVWRVGKVGSSSTWILGEFYNKANADKAIKGLSNMIGTEGKPAKFSISKDTAYYSLADAIGGGLAKSSDIPGQDNR